MEQNKYYIKLRCGEEFRFTAYKEVTITKKYISLKIRMANERIYCPHNDRLSMRCATIFGVETRKNYLVLLKGMIEMTNVDWAKSSSKPTKDYFTCLGQFFVKHNRAPTNKEKQRIAEECK